MKRLFILLALAALSGAAFAQRTVDIHRGLFAVPYQVGHVESLTADGGTLTLTTTTGDDICFALDTVDSLAFALPPLAEGKDRYRVFPLYITTSGGQGVESRETYTPVYFSLNALGQYAQRDTAALMRQRGNSSRLWYDKKPYRLKLPKKQKMLGMGKSKSWVLLANYRDATDLMNTFAFAVARMMGLPYPNHTRYVELFLDGEYLGLYQLTEQVQQGENRVAVSDEGGVLLSLDVDDGPSEAPEAMDNFWTEVYTMPACVKYPEDGERRDSVRALFGALETAIHAKSYAQVDSLLDLRSMVHYLLLQELVENVELVAPRSVFLSRDTVGKWQMGPAWDFDAGYDFDWSDMQTGHTFFADHRELVLGSNPLLRNGYDSNIPGFFTDLFALPEFVSLYKAEWDGLKDTLLTTAWGEMERHLAALREGPMAREMARWPLTDSRGRRFDFETEVSKMKTWLERRVAYLGTIIPAIPDPSPDDPSQEHVAVGEIHTSVSLMRALGYSQYATIDIDQEEVCRLLGIASWQFDSAKATLTPLTATLDEGENHTNGTYGGWFDEDGNPGYWAAGHTYIEVYDDLFSWQCGVHPDNCRACASHVDRMRLAYRDGGQVKTIDIAVEMRIE